MFNFSENIKKAQQENSNISVMVKSSAVQPAAKITIERLGEDPVVINNVQDFLAFARSDSRFYGFGSSSLQFLLSISKLIKGKIDDALGNGFVTKS
ncbi:hypothetical protein HSX37_16430|uniref:Uncharacterized protein n=1 Tax=Dendrosporobacter quercicolus TaxID=146817 RepID=A0A1G9ZVC5_9FIRM|nr:hypothetical protein [Dendrosporobacter quercicolus]NSL49624.1 hypothetical protein [Dendrosporobacter quercicolus DSM 1736]SDN25389.1 hypothetical protein SAMN04488502_11580 [Dendrosporobacter quercicolus]